MAAAEVEGAEEPVEPKLHGPEEFIFPNGAKYRGTYIYEDGDVPVYHGEGEYVHGYAIYSGYWVKGHLTTGKYAALAHVYEGEFNEAFQYHGSGTYKWPDGRLYKGDMFEGKIHGSGRYENFQRVNNTLAEKNVRRHRMLLSKSEHLAWENVANVRGGVGKDFFEGLSHMNTFNSNAAAQQSLIPAPVEEEPPPEA